MRNERTDGLPCGESVPSVASGRSVAIGRRCRVGRDWIRRVLSCRCICRWLTDRYRFNRVRAPPTLCIILEHWQVAVASFAQHLFSVCLRAMLDILLEGGTDSRARWRYMYRRYIRRSILRASVGPLRMLCGIAPHLSRLHLPPSHL